MAIAQTLVQDSVEQVRVMVRIPRAYHEHALISHLIRDCGLEVNIYAA
ncbi:MAG: hypothetical protein Q6L68_13955 [Thermostichus sp. DG02_5_bins_236]